jgi:hypothetical protein
MDDRSKRNCIKAENKRDIPVLDELGRVDLVLVLSGNLVEGRRYSP